MKPKQTNQITECSRCGTCCLKGGPALHEADRQIIDNGILPLTSLYTIRKGELARDHINGGLVQLPAEILKIKSLKKSTTCMYFNEMDKQCSIYDHRPIECRTLECWNTRAIESMYSRNRLTRKMLLKKVGWLIELVETHESECGLDKIQHLVNDREAGDPGASIDLMQLINYDLHFRNLVMEKGKIALEMLDFLFGRPLSVIISTQFGVKIDKKKPDSF
ncbi:MAG: YkgJ family cysteine cluster protein [Desulfobacteraceae bacterium]|nr:YkgJ family cysteine cluster protein [Desulfobacteraceae bacterium]MBC2754640.1 YkgJ family cysteine cluster protein [Desulfobacteraceae bacterium]